MKINAMRRLVKSTGRLELIDYEAEDGTIEQWIGCGKCAWPELEMPYLTLGNVVRLLELGDKEMETIEAEHLQVQPGRLRHGDEEEIPLSPSVIELGYLGERFMLLRSNDGRLWCLNKELLSPKDKGWDPEFYWRPDLNYIAVKHGLMLEGVALPETAGAELLPALVGNLGGCEWQTVAENERNGEAYEQEEFAAAGLPGDGADGVSPE